MPYKENLKKAAALKKELDNYRPLSPEVEKRIMQKFRLDWNYHSSHIEGNTLTYGETKALILFGQTAQAKPLKDHLEMSGHNEAITTIEEVVKQQQPLTEKFIREIHELILKEPYEVEAITPDGKPTKKIIRVGQYKTTPNHVKTQTGEIFYFATPEETPAKMYDLLNWYTENVDKEDLDPILFATEFHYRFIRIHPFDDGNGRMARLLMNFILLQKGYPPAIIKTEEKQDYFRALQQADAGQLDFFFNYIASQVIHSLELMIKGAKGEEIEDPDDIDKKIELLKVQLGKKDIFTKSKTKEVLTETLSNSIIPTFERIDEKCFKMKELFMSIDRTLWVRGTKGTNNIENNSMDWVLQKNRLINDLLTTNNLYNELQYTISLRGFKRSKSTPYLGIDLKVEFNEFNFVFTLNNDLQTQKLFIYDNQLTEKEKLQIVNTLIEGLMADMQRAAGINK